MKRNNVVILTTIFQQDISYVSAYFESVAQQTFQDFDLLIINDGFSNLAKIREAYPTINIIEFAGTGKIAKNRELLVNNSLELGYTKAIFADFDDYFSLNRVETQVALLDVYDIVVNDLAMVVNNVVMQEHYFANVLFDRQQIVLSDVLEFNFLGMSNTAIKLSGLKKVKFDEQLKAVDWFFFSEMLINGARAIFTNQCITYYRQHENNVANIGCVTMEQLINEMSVKSIHYSQLVFISKIYEPLLAGVQDFNQRSDTEAFMKYYKSVEKQTKPPFWWNIFNLNDYLASKYETDK